METIEEFVQATEHFHEVLEKGGSSDHVKRDFADVNRIWRHLTRDINAIAPDDHYHLRSIAHAWT